MFCHQIPPVRRERIDFLSRAYLCYTEIRFAAEPWQAPASPFCWWEGCVDHRKGFQRTSAVSSEQGCGGQQLCNVQVKGLEPSTPNIGGRIREARAAVKAAKRVDLYKVTHLTAHPHSENPDPFTGKVNEGRSPAELTCPILCQSLTHISHSLCGGHNMALLWASGLVYSPPNGPAARLR